MMNVYEYEAVACLALAERINEQVLRGELSHADAESNLIALEAVINAYKTYSRVTLARWRQAGRLTGWWPGWWVEPSASAANIESGKRK